MGVQPIESGECCSAVTLGHRGVMEDVMDKIPYRSSISSGRLSIRDDLIEAPVPGHEIELPLGIFPEAGDLAAAEKWPLKLIRRLAVEESEAPYRSIAKIRIEIGTAQTRRGRSSIDVSTRD